MIVPGATSVRPASRTSATQPVSSNVSGLMTRARETSWPSSAAITAAWAIWASVLPELISIAGLSA